VSAIIVSKIGEGAASYMEGKGKAVYEAPFEIEPLISNIISNRLFEADNWSAVQ
jgi:predicted Fe-Mo cluster-binding NifX family protein